MPAPYKAANSSGSNRGPTSQALIDRDKDDAEKLKENRAVIDAAKRQAYVGEALGSDVRRLVATEAQTGSKFG